MSDITEYYMSKERLGSRKKNGLPIDVKKGLSDTIIYGRGVKSWVARFIFKDEIERVWSQD